MDWIPLYYWRSLERNHPLTQEQKDALVKLGSSNSDQKCTPAQVLMLERTPDAQSSTYCSFGDNALLTEMLGSSAIITDQHEN